MLIAVVLALASTGPLSTTVTAPTTAPPPAAPFCEAGGAIVAHPTLSDADRARALTELLDEAMPHVVAHASERAAGAGDLGAALPVLAHAVRVACDARAIDAAAARARAEEIVLHSVAPVARAEGDLLDVFIARARAWLVSFLESAGMQRFAGVSRIVYLAAVAGVAALLALRLLAERRRRTRAPATTRRAASVSLTRAPRTADALLVEAERALVSSDAQTALARVEEALAVLCTEDPARAERDTFDALLAAVPEPRRRTLAPVVRTVARARYARVDVDGRARLDDARALVAACRALAHVPAAGVSP